MNNETEIDIFISDVLNDKKYIFQIARKIKAIDLKSKLEKFLAITNFEFRYKGQLYERNQIISFEDGDTIYIYRKEEQKKNNNSQVNQQDKNINTTKLSKFLHLFLVKYISNKINDIRVISNDNLRNIIYELKGNIELKIDKLLNIKIYTKENFERNLISYANYIYLIIGENEINLLLNLLNEKIINEIFEFQKILSIYEQYQSFFEKDLTLALEKSHFEYCITGIQLLSLKDNIKYFEESKKCQNKITKYLFHEKQSNMETESNNNTLNYSKKPYFGMGIYFTDSLDYIAYKARNKNNELISINSSFSCNISQIYYDNKLKKDVINFDYFNKELDHFPTYEEICSNSSNKKVVKNGLHFVRIKADSGQLVNENELKNKNKHSLIGKEYIITEKEQILPLFNLDFKRNESLIIWRDPKINENTSNARIFSESKMFINKYLKINAYFVNSIENSLELIKRKSLNKIILISNIGLDLSGKRLMEIARKILGFPIVILFFSVNNNHLKWIKDEENILITNNINLYLSFILDYKKENLLSLKTVVENNYKNHNIKLKFTEDFFKFPKFIDKKEYKDIIFNEISPNFKKVIIKNFKNYNILCLDEKGNIAFKPMKEMNNENYSYIWYVTINVNDITFYTNQFYMGVNEKKGKIVKDQFMKVWNYAINGTYYLIYYKNFNQILTDNQNEAIVEKEIDRNYNQLFTLVEKDEDF